MKIILLICLLNCVNCLLKSREYLIDTCCSLNGNDRLYLSCNLNEQIHLNLIEIFYNSNEYCSSEFNCCKYRTKCSRRITKYFNLHCDQKNSCWIDKTCLKIFKPCSNIYGLYGQYITINYSCLSINQTNSEEEEDQSGTFIVQLLTSQDKTTTTKNFILINHLKSSPIFLIGIILTFILLMLFIYGLANRIANSICRKDSLEKSELIPQKFLFKHENVDKIGVESVSSLPVTRIYPCQSIYRYEKAFYDNSSIPYLNNRSKQYINIQHNPYTGQISSRIINGYFNYY
jgi:hypothetical protein